MTVVFFSGGIDSTVLAYDVAKNPERYGISIERSSPLILLTAAVGVEPERKAELLGPLVDGLCEVSSLEIQHVVEKVPLVSYDPPIRVLHGSLQFGPVAAETQTAGRIRQSTNYTAGLHLWLASVAINLEAQLPVFPHHNSPTAFWGFQFDGPSWEDFDHGRMVPNDTSPTFVRKLDELSGYSGHNPSLRFRAPFLENRMDRLQILRMGLKLGVPLDKTSSCTTGWMAACGHCRQCVVRAQALAVLAHEGRWPCK